MGEVLAITSLGDDDIKRLKDHCVRLAKSGLVPDHFAKTPEAVYTALEMARALQEEPVTLMQSIYFIGGKAGFAASYMLSRMRRRGVIRGTVRYLVTGKGDGLAVRASVVDAVTGEVIEGPEVSMDMARAEGWTKNAKYKSMPEVMLRKRAITFLVREHYPDVLMGFHTLDEIEDVHAARTIRVAGTSSAIDDINAAIAGELAPPSGPIDVEPAAEEA